MLSEARSGDLVVFRRTGPVSAILGGLLQLLQPRWDGWGWHTALYWQPSKVFGNATLLLEAVSSGVSLRYHPYTELHDNCRFYRWLPEEPPADQREKFLDNYEGKRYDIAIYFWTAIALILRHFWNRPIPKLLDDRYSCWELVQEFFADMGKPLVSRYDTVIITDIMDNVEGA